MIEFCHSIISQFAGKMSNPHLVEELMANFWRMENEALTIKTTVLERHLDNLTARLLEANYHIDRLQSDLLHYRRALQLHRQNERVIVDRNGRHTLFRRNAQGVFVPVESMVESDISEPDEEDVRETARRLGFETDSEYDSDDIMTELMGM